MIIKTPVSLKFIWLCRYYRENDALFSRWEARIQKRLARKFETLPDGQIRPVREMSCEAFQNLPASFFDDKNLEPFVVRGFMDAEMISADMLSDHYGEELITAHPEADMRPEATMVAIRQMSISSLLTKIRGGQAATVFAATDIYKRNPELINFAGLKQIEAIIGANKVMKSELFMGGAGSGSNYHRACIDNFFMMLEGKKSWHLVDPRQMVAMAPEVGRRRGASVMSSEIATAHLNKNKHPLYSKIDVQTVTLEPGDLFFNPNSWWHEVKNDTLAVGAAHRVLSRRHYTFLHYLMNTVHGRPHHILKRSIIQFMRRKREMRPRKLTDAQALNSFGRRL